MESRGFDPFRYKWQGVAFFKWYKPFYHDIVEHHHRVEEEIYFPWIKSKLGVDMPALKDSTHYDVKQALAKTKHAAERVLVLNDVDNVDKLREAALSLTIIVKMHMAEVEKLFAQLLPKHFTSEEQKEKFDKILDDRGLYGNKVFLPVVLQAIDKWGGAKLKQRFKASLPLAYRTMLDLGWQDHMQIHNWKMIQALREPSKPSSTVRGLGYSLVLEHVELIIAAVVLLGVTVLLYQMLAVMHRSNFSSRSQAKKSD